MGTRWAGLALTAEVDLWKSILIIPSGKALLKDLSYRPRLILWIYLVMQVIKDDLPQKPTGAIHQFVPKI
jgi:hypothetical protein